MNAAIGVQIRPQLHEVVNLLRVPVRHAGLQIEIVLGHVEAAAVIRPAGQVHPYAVDLGRALYDTVGFAVARFGQDAGDLAEFRIGFGNVLLRQSGGGPQVLVVKHQAAGDGALFRHHVNLAVLHALTFHDGAVNPVVEGGLVNIVTQGQIPSVADGIGSLNGLWAGKQVRGLPTADASHDGFTQASPGGEGIFHLHIRMAFQPLFRGFLAVGVAGVAAIQDSERDLLLCHGGNGHHHGDQEDQGQNQRELAHGTTSF